MALSNPASLSLSFSLRRRSSLSGTTRSQQITIGRPKAYLGISECDDTSNTSPFERHSMRYPEKPGHISQRRLLRAVTEGPGCVLREPGRSRPAVVCRAGIGAIEEALFDQEEDTRGYLCNQEEDTRGDWGVFSSYMEEDTRSYLRDTPGDWLRSTSTSSGGVETAVARPGRLPLPRYTSDRADNVALHNPLKRLERLGCGWLTVLMEWEGVIVEDDPALERKSWAMLASEEGKPQPPGFLLRRADGMKNEQAIMEVFCWGREYKAVKRLAQRRDEIYEELQGGCYRLLPGAKEFVESLKKYDIPVAVVSTRPRKLLDRAIEAVGMEGVFDLVVSAEDVQRGKPDPEMFQYASMCLQFIPERCIVVGNANSTIEAAHDALMKVVAVAGKHPAYELGAADLVVSRLDNLSMVDLKKLADLDSVEFTPQLELEEEFEEERPKAAVAEL